MHEFPLVPRLEDPTLFSTCHIQLIAGYVALSQDEMVLNTFEKGLMVLRVNGIDYARGELITQNGECLFQVSELIS